MSSDWGPVKVTVELGGEPPASRSTSPATRQDWVEHTWCGEIEFDHPKFFVSSFDQFPQELSGLVLPRGLGRYSMVVTWSYQGGRPVPQERPFVGEVIPHSDGLGAFFIPDPNQPPLVLTDQEMDNPASEEFWERLLIRIG